MPGPILYFIGIWNNAASSHSPSPRLQSHSAISLNCFYIYVPLQFAIMSQLGRFALLVSLLVRCIYAQTVVNGQVLTPGIVLVDAPQPNTPLGGGKSPPPSFVFLANG